MNSRRFPATTRFPQPLKPAVAIVLITALAVPPPALSGDILRGGGNFVVPRGAGTAPIGNTAATAQARANAKDALARTTEAVTAVQRMQLQAKYLSQNAGANPNQPGTMLPNVPNGLVPGGLHVDPAVAGNPALWRGANLPTQSVSGESVNVNIKQTQQQALLNWKTFNVGRQTTVNFDQSAGGSAKSQWIAFNKVNDPSGVPSQILGRINADGQVYVINQNGIIFGGGSQVNTHTLVASSLPINENLLNSGLLNNPDSQFLFSSIPQPAGSKGTPAHTPEPPPNTPGGRLGDVIVQQGARLTAPTTENNVGGRVALVGPNVKNFGTISTPDGQTILAAGLQVGFAAHSSQDPSLRGLDVFVGAVNDPASATQNYAGTAANHGMIEAARANVTMAGKTVNQMGAIDSSTTVSLNGRVDLQANYDAVANTKYDPTNSAFGPPFLFRSTGAITLGTGSVTRILPEWADPATITGTKLPLQSQIKMQGRTVHFESNALMMAPSGSVTATGGIWDYQQTTQSSTFVNNSGQIYLDSGSMINVAGSTDVPSELSKYIVELQLRGSELADSPLQRTGVLRGPTLTVDLRQTGTYGGFKWVGTPLADLTGYLNIIERNVGELTTAAGTVNLTGGSSVVVQHGAKVDVSGGWLNYNGGMVKTSRVLSGGNLIKIENALPGIVYDGIFTGQFTEVHDPRWGVTHTFNSPLAPTGEHWEEPYLQGMAGGTFGVTAPSVALDGEFTGLVSWGPRQRPATDIPTPSSFNLTFEAQEPVSPYFTVSPTPPTVVFDHGSQGAAAPFAVAPDGAPLPLREDRRQRVLISPDIFAKSGFGGLSVKNSDGNIFIPAGITLNPGPLGSLTLEGANLNIHGTVDAPGGKLNFTALNFSPYELAKLRANPAGASTPPPNPTRGNFTLGSSATLNAAGLIVDDRLFSPTLLEDQLAIAGGSVSITTYNANLNKGSLIDVSGGVAVGPTGRRTFGDAGSIVIKAGQDPNVLSILGGHLHLGAELRGFSGTKGGALTLQAPLIQIGGHAGYPGTLLLRPDFFNEGGFASFTLNGIGTTTEDGKTVPGLVIAKKTVIKPVVQSWVAASWTEGDSGIALIPVIQPESLRSPVTLNFGALGVLDSFDSRVVVRGDILMNQGARIEAGPLGTVSFKGDTVAILGSVYAPGGVINVTGASRFPSNNPLLTPLPTVHLGPRSVLSTAGRVYYTPDAHGYNTGYALAGGTINVSGNIVAERGALLDVSGTSGVLDYLPGYSQFTRPSPGSFLGYTMSPVRVDTNGGTIVFKGGQEMFIDATLKGNAGGPNAVGGTLVISSGRFDPPGVVPTPDLVNLVVTQNGPTIPRRFYPAGQTAIGHAVLGTDGNPLPGMGYFAASTFLRGGFGALTLGGNVQFSGPVNLSAERRISVASGGFLYADDVVNLTAPYVALGTAFQPPLAPTVPQNPFSLAGEPFFTSPTWGTGVLNVTAQLIDIGNLSLGGIGRANLKASHDIRGNGTFNIAGDLFMQAGQIYPTTGAKFTLSAFDYSAEGSNHPGTITFAGGAVQPLPLAGGGQLNVYASVINQGGTLKAPLGIINLGWDGSGTAPVNQITGGAVPKTETLNLLPGSVTSVSAIDPTTGRPVIIPYGYIASGTSWIDPAGVDITASGPPDKAINLSAANIAAAAGSVLDIRGGGDLYAYRWVKGIGGSKDILASTGSFAILPGYRADWAPYGAFSVPGLGYENSSLQPGDSIYLAGGLGFPAGRYTLLPARYALLPGAFLITPQAGQPVGTMLHPDGSAFVTGYRYNEFDRPSGQPLLTRFEVAPGPVTRSRAEYQDYFATSFISEYAASHELKTPRLPNDSGRLVMSAANTMTFRGVVTAEAAAGGRGALIDISSPSDIFIGGPSAVAPPGTLVLNAADLTGFGAASLLIGGLRTEGATATSVAVKTSSITVDNAGIPLSGPDIILVSNQTLTLAPGALLQSSGAPAGADPLLLGTDGVNSSGDGTLVRVSSDPNATVLRRGVSNAPGPNLIVGDGAQLSGGSVILDSTSATNLSPTATLNAQSIALNSGQISLLLDNPDPVNPTTGLVLAGGALDTLQQAKKLSLLSYSSLDIYGTGVVGSAALANLEIHAAQIRGFNADVGSVTFAAGDILIDNNSNGTVPGIIAPAAGTLAFDATNIRLGANTVQIDQYASVALNAANTIIAQGVGGLKVQGALTAVTPAIVGAKGANYSIEAGGALVLQKPAGGGTSTTPAATGARLSLSGSSVTANTNILLPSGILSLTGTGGDVIIGGTLDASGTTQAFYDQTRYTDAGQVTVVSSTGNVSLLAGGRINVAAQPGGGNAGALSIGAPQGSFSLTGTLSGKGGTGGSDGVFALDAGTVGALAPVNAALNAASFSEARNLRVRSGDITVDHLIRSRNVTLSADNGSISVLAGGLIDASGITGGAINLLASNSVILDANSRLTVAGQQFDAAGKVGSISLESRGAGGGLVDIRTDSALNLAVAGTPQLGQFSGTLHLRAPQNTGGTDLLVAPINGDISGASKIVVEGYRIYDLTNPAGSSISAAVQNSVKTDSNAFLGAAGAASAGYNAMLTRVLGSNAADLSPVLTIQPGAEIINPSGDLRLGTTASNSSADWDLSTFRFGPKSVPGVLTLRAGGNLTLFNTISDGFASSAYTAQLMPLNSQLAGNNQSWSYRLTAGADFTAADFRQVLPAGSLAAGAGSLQLGKNAGGTGIINIPGGADAQTSTAIGNRYQVIRTGTGDISISTGRDVHLLNQFATIYTAGSRVADPTLGGTFDVPTPRVTNPESLLTKTTLGAAQQSTPYPAQFALGGGNVAINAQGNIAHKTVIGGQLVDDSERQLPTGWLYRRGYVDPLTGQFGKTKFNEPFGASTAWWVDYSNFFEGVGALGGGNVTLNAGLNISNVDAVVPTNARMPSGTPNLASLVELGGGDLVVRAGRNIDAGVYYVERGRGILSAGESIVTNATRSMSQINASALPPETWLPTTLFLGKGKFDVSARNSLTLGPVANPFLLPAGYNNSFWYKTYFSTYDPGNAVSLSALSGDITLRQSAAFPNANGVNAAQPLLQSWYERVLLYTPNAATAASGQPWLRLNESSVQPFGSGATLMPATLRASAFSGNINLVGNITLAPAPTGTLDLTAAGAINGLQPNGRTTVGGQPFVTWGASRLNLSDANPAALPGVATPFAYQSVLAPTDVTRPAIASATGDTFLRFVDVLFAESGATKDVVLQTKQSLHTPGLLHAGDTTPLRLYAAGGDISGLTLFSPKSSLVFANRDVTDIALYLQNVRDTDFSVVSSGRDIIAYNPNSALRSAALAAGNRLSGGVAAQAGDLQINGPGTIEVLAGRNLDLGVGPTNADGTGSGLVSVGNARNPYLPFEGASIVGAAGIGGPASLANNENVDYSNFLTTIIAGPDGARYLEELGRDDVNQGNLDALPPEEKAKLALDLFFIVLRDSGRDYAAAGSPTAGTYSAGLAAIEAFFPSTYTGDISLTSRLIKTASGGDVSLIAPGGKLVVGIDAGENQSADQGILTEAGGNINIFTKGNVDVGTSRIFTLRGGDIIIWSSEGDIAAGAAAKTVQSAPPTRVIIDPQSADVKTDLAGLATGGGIGVLDTVKGLEPGNVDLIAPMGVIDAGDAGIRSSGNLNVAATQVLNASNISVSGSSAGTPTTAVSVPALPGGPPPAPPNTGSSNAAAEAQKEAMKSNAPVQEPPPSIITVEVIGYGGGEGW